MTIERKWLTASIATKDTGGDTGGFEAVLSTPDVDRDGESIDIKSWGELPPSVPVNLDHEMNISGLVGTGIPRFEDGVVKLSVTFASTPEAQKARTLVNEGHIKATSVEFLRKTETDTKGVKTTSREMIGAALTNYPANIKAVVLSSKSANDAKFADIELEGKRYILCYTETDDEIQPTGLIRDLTDPGTKSADASTDASADSDAESFLFNAKATQLRLALLTEDSQ